MTATAVLTTEPPSVTTKPSLSLPKRRSGLWASRALLPRARFSQPVATASRVPRAFLVRRASVQDRWNPVVAAPGTQPPEPSASSLVIPQDAEGTECTNAGPSTSTLVIPQHAEATEYDNAGTAGEVRSHAAPHDVAPAAAPSPTTAAAAPVPPPTSQRGHEDHGSLRGSTAAGPVYTIRPRRLEPERPSTIGIVLPVSFGVVLLTVAAVLLMVH